MKIVTLEFTDDDADRIAHYLHQRYGRDENTELLALCKMAIRAEVTAQLKVDLDSCGEMSL